jgi:hypothetical protein
MIKASPGIVSMVGLTLLVPRLASACGATPLTEWKLERVLPAAGQAVPTDGALVIQRRALAPAGEGSRAASEVSVIVRDAAGVAIPGTTEPWYDEGQSLIWRPQASLPAGATLSVEASVGAPSSAPAATDGLRLAETVQTSAGPAAPLRLLGELAVSIETYDQPTVLPCTPCVACPPGPPIRALRARVTIPAVEGGFAAAGYNAWVWLTDDHPHPLPDGPTSGSEVNVGGLERLGQGSQPMVAFREVPAEGRDYSPCVSVRVYDPAGHFEDRSTCLPALNVAATIADLDAGHAQSSGCSVGGTSRGASAVWLGLLGALALARLLAARTLRR